MFLSPHTTFLCICDAGWDLKAPTTLKRVDCCSHGLAKNDRSALVEQTTPAAIIIVDASCLR